MTDLDEKEQNHVRTAIRILQRQVGGQVPLADGLHYGIHTIRKVLNRGDVVGAKLAFRVARLAGIPLDDLLAGKFTPAGTCPHCGRSPDFADENTVVEDAPPSRPTPSRNGRGRAGLKAVK